MFYKIPLCQCSHIPSFPCTATGRLSLFIQLRSPPPLKRCHCPRRSKSGASAGLRSPLTFAVSGVLKPPVETNGYLLSWSRTKEFSPPSSPIHVLYTPRFHT